MRQRNVSSVMRTFLPVVVAAFHFIVPASTMAESALGDEFFEAVHLVSDPDGFTNLRAEPSAKSEIVGKVKSGSVVAIEPVTKGDWAAVARESIKGQKRFIHTSRLKPLTEWKKKEVGDWNKKGSATLKSGAVEVTVSEASFKESAHKVTKTKEGMVLVDGAEPWGQDGGLPQKSLKLTVSVNGVELKLPAEATANLYEPTVGSMVILTPSTAEKHCVIAMLNSDGAGAYYVAWAFVDGAYVGRSVFTPF